MTIHKSYKLIILHVIFASFFIFYPYFNYITQEFSHVTKLQYPPNVDTNNFFIKHMPIRFCIQNAILIVLFYFNYFFLVPIYYVKKRKHVFYYFLAITSSFTFLYIIYLFHYLIDLQIGFLPLSFLHKAVNNVSPIIVVMFTSTVIKLSSHYNALINKQKEAQQKHLTAELDFLRSQINPHFLFNTLNNIYSLSLAKSDDVPDAIVKLSGLMRFVLYESSVIYIPLEKELGYISDYLSLQKIRLDEKVLVTYTQEGEYINANIGPMLLISFIENAFKHGVSYSNPSHIKINILTTPAYLVLRVENSIFPNSITEENKEGGIGLSNVKRRLELLYHNKHELTLQKENNIFIAYLKINF